MMEGEGLMMEESSTSTTTLHSKQHIDSPVAGGIASRDIGDEGALCAISHCQSGLLYGEDIYRQGENAPGPRPCTLQTLP